MRYSHVETTFQPILTKKSFIIHRYCSPHRNCISYLILDHATNWCFIDPWIFCWLFSDRTDNYVYLQKSLTEKNLIHFPKTVWVIIILHWCKPKHFPLKCTKLSFLKDLKLDNDEILIHFFNTRYYKTNTVFTSWISMTCWCDIIVVKFHLNISTIRGIALAQSVDDIEYMKCSQACFHNFLNDL